MPAIQADRAVILVIHTADGTTGVGMLEGAPLKWTARFPDHTVSATLALLENDKTREVAKLTGDQWRAFEAGGHGARFLANVRNGLSLADALHWCV